MGNRHRGGIAAIRLALSLVVLGLMVPSLTGCRYFTNRVADFKDIGQLGAGISVQNPESGPLPPSYGLLVQATDFVKLGWVVFHGYSAEWDGRGCFAGREDRERHGFFWGFLKTDIKQQNPKEYFKLKDTPWASRMNSEAMRFRNHPAKDLTYGSEPASLFPRGYQYWENFGVEVGIPELVITHTGINLRAGIDPSEVMDFVLGIFTIDLWKDDLTQDEFDQRQAQKDSMKS